MGEADARDHKTMWEGGFRGGGMAPEEASTLPRDADAKNQVKLGEAGEHAWGGPTEAEEPRGDLKTEAPGTRGGGHGPYSCLHTPLSSCKFPFLGLRVGPGWGAVSWSTELGDGEGEDVGLGA